MSTAWKLFALGVGAGIAVLVARTALLVAQDVSVPMAAAAPLALPEAALAQRLSGALQLRTISPVAGQPETQAPFEALHAYLRAQFPRAHQALQHEVVGGGSLLYRWPGAAPDLAPVLWLAHLDVVPVEPGTASRWRYPPFSGAVADGQIWGRGALDDKGSALAQLEAVEYLLSQGFTPRRTLWLAFGHDEEIGGADGARRMAAHLQAQGVRAAWLLDEGGAITEGVVAGVSRPVASIMTAEKGYVSFRLVARGAGGHSSMPPRQTAVGQLARAVARVQDAPMPARLTPPVAQMLTRLAPEMPWINRVLIANQALFEPVLLQALAGQPVTRALIRTTTAPTVFHGGVKDNVLPSEAEAVINFRLLPGDSVADVEAHLRKVIDDDGIELSVLAGFGQSASRVSPADGAAFALLERTTREVFPDVVVTTGIVTGATDARHYDAVAETRYNFLPIVLKAADLARIHGTDERIGIDAYADAVRWYIRLLQNLEDSR